MSCHVAEEMAISIANYEVYVRKIVEFQDCLERVRLKVNAEKTEVWLQWKKVTVMPTT